MTLYLTQLSCVGTWWTRLHNVIHFCIIIFQSRVLANCLMSSYETLGYWNEYWHADHVRLALLALVTQQFDMIGHWALQQLYALTGLGCSTTDNGGWTKHKQSLHAGAVQKSNERCAVRRINTKSSERERCVERMLAKHERALIYRVLGNRE